ncbi:MAG: SRPBCC family protein [Mesorhizobium sp.]|nr:SRPBCC family protein [Mesorhizobium sp.]
MSRDPGSDGQGVVPEPGTVRIERLLPGPAQRVWDFLVVSEKRRLWLAAGEMEPWAGGDVTLLFRHSELSHEASPEGSSHEARAGSGENPPMHGRVTQWDPPRTLSYSWPGDGGSSEVTFELFPEGSEVLLVLTHRRLADDDTMIMVASGWDSHLGILIDRLRGDTPRGFWSTFARLKEVYAGRLSA